MKVCVVTPIYTIAGVPLAQHRLARALADQGYDVDFVIGRIEAGYTVPPAAGVNVIALERPNVRSLLIPLMRYLRAAKPEIVFSAEDHLNAITLLAAIASNSGAKISGSSRVTPFDTYSNTPFSKRWFLKHIVRAVMWRADALTCVSEDMVKQYQQVFRRAPHICIYNIVDDASSRLRMQEALDHPWLTHKECPVLVAAGRLAPWKGFTDLLHAMKLLERGPKVRLLILGDGPLRAELQGMIDELGLRDAVQLLGYVDNPLKYYRQADAFVLSSLVEGLPNVLVEAMLCGCTPVATDCPTGPREVLGDGKYGYLVPVRNPEALAEGIMQALANPVPQARLSEAVLPFSEGRVLARHFEVLGAGAPQASAQGPR
jgi:glycosyltransferase involved in cell wall biosynthesis